MEGVAISYARIAGQLSSAAGPPRHVLASGRITQDVPDLLQLLADALGVPVLPVTGKRTTLHGTAIMALDVAAPGEPRAKPATGAARRPAAGASAYYAERARAYQALYETIAAPPAGQALRPGAAAGYHREAGDATTPARGFPITPEAL
jgi:gluconokinase